MDFLWVHCKQGSRAQIKLTPLDCSCGRHLINFSGEVVTDASLVDGRNGDGFVLYISNSFRSRPQITDRFLAVLSNIKFAPQHTIFSLDGS
jgi:hypothetical protein